MLRGPQPGIVAILVTVWTLSTISLVLRLAARRMTRISMWLDDFACIAAYSFGTVYNAWAVIWIHDGFGLRLDEVTWMSRAEAISRAKRDVYFFEAFNALSIGFSKLAILALYWRLFSLTKMRYAIMYLAFLSLCWLVARTTVGIVRCIPVASFWDTSVRGECFVDEVKIIYGGSISHLILDTLILILPLFELHKLRLKFWPKVGVIAIFMFGIVTCMCAVVVITLAVNMPTDEEINFNARIGALIAHVEVNFSIVTSCLPLLRPFFKSLFVRRKCLTGLSCNCLRTGASPPSRSSPGDPEQQQQQQQQQQQLAPRRRRRFNHPMSLSTTLFGTTTWSHLSSAATGTGTSNSRSGERPTHGRNKTDMTVVRDETSQGVHVQLRRDFGFVSPPAPEPSPARPPRANSLVELEKGADVPAKDEDLVKDEENAASGMDKGKGKADEKVHGPTQPESEGTTKNEEKTLAESEGEPQGAETASFVVGEEKAPRELCAFTQESEAARCAATARVVNEEGDALEACADLHKGRPDNASEKTSIALTAS